MIHGVIMAGGIGTRFWPQSRKDTPKQVLSIGDDVPLISATVDRIRPMIPIENIWIITNLDQKPVIQKHLVDVDDEHFIVEPMGKNTAPCIGLAAIHLKHIDPEAIMVVLPADHRITEDDRFRECLQAAADQAVKSQCLVTIGIEPSRPETGYGYIQYNRSLDSADKRVYHVKTFAEKPSLNTAKLFLQSGDFLWNSGIFVWTVDQILAEIDEHMPELHAGLMEIDRVWGTDRYASALDRIYRSIKSISIDYGVMEHAQHVCVVRGDFSWSDVGSWEEVYRISKKDALGNAVVGEGLTLDSEGCLIHSPGHLVAVLGAKDLVVISTSDATLVCTREAAQDVKKVVETLLRKKADKYL
jgi:mannose-1-phosphate guanylyltransferase